MVAVKAITLTVGIMGVSIIVWGSVMSFIDFTRLEYKRFKGVDVCRKRLSLRHHLGSYILIGLEFLIAADIVLTILKPGITELIILGSIVAIRTVISYFLNKEIRESESCDEEQKGRRSPR